MTAAIFRQLYEQDPFNKDYELLYDIQGKVHQTKDYVLFSTPTDVRKFNVRYFTSKISTSSLSQCLYRTLKDIQVMELDHIRIEIYNYFKGRRYDYDIGNYTREVLDRLLGKNDNSYATRKEDGEILLSCLEGEFKLYVENEYKKGAILVENHNKLVDIFKNAPQIFI